MTDNLNFGNPYKPENFWQLREAVEGIAEACRAFGTPVIGGNVSLYNESPAGVVDPTPTVAMVGLIDDEKHITTQWFKNEGMSLFWLEDALRRVQRPGRHGGRPSGRGQRRGYSLGGSRFLKVCFGKKIGPVPELDIELELAVQNAVRDLIRLGLVRSAHDCSEGGLAVALAECCFSPDRLFGAEINFENRRLRRRDACLDRRGYIALQRSAIARHYFLRAQKYGTGFVGTEIEKYSACTDRQRDHR